MKEKLFMSGYTKAENKGINIFDLDVHENSIEILETEYINEENPSYLDFDKRNEFIFAVTSRDGGGVAVYKKIENGYKLMDTLGGLGKAPCHLYYDYKRELLYSSNYHLGKLDIIKVHKTNEQSQILELLNTIVFNGSGLISPNQDSSRCHMAVLDNDGKYVIVVDLGADSVYTYDVDEFGEYELKSIYKTSSGMGPRHIVFRNDGKFAYLLGELDSHIDILRYDKMEGVFSYIDRVKTLPEDYKSENSASAIKASGDGKFLYASNRGHDSIAIFRIFENGNLELVEISKTGGRTPRDFGFINDEKFIVVGHQDDKKVTIFKRDKMTGRMKQFDDKIFLNSEIVYVKSYI